MSFLSITCPCGSGVLEWEHDQGYTGVVSDGHAEHDSWQGWRCRSCRALLTEDDLVFLDETEVLWWLDQESYQQGVADAPI